MTHPKVLMIGNTKSKHKLRRDMEICNIRRETQKKGKTINLNKKKKRKEGN